MKSSLPFLLAIVFTGQLANATNLSIGQMPTIYVPWACWDQALSVYWQPPITSSFSLTGLAGQGTVFSRANSLVSGSGSIGIFHEYQLDLSSVVQTSGGQHCVALEIYFGSTVSCDVDSNSIPDQVLVISNNVTPIGVYSAVRNSGFVTMTFGTNCLAPGSKTRNFGMISDMLPKVGQVTVVHTVVNGAVTTTNRYPVKALVPDVPPEISMFIPPGFQALLKTTNSDSAFNGLVQLKASLHNAPVAGQQISFTVTQAVTVANGVFTSPLPFEATDFVGSGRWLDLAVQPIGSPGPFTPLSPRLPVSPAPQAVFAYGAGSVASLKPGQAVTSLNGLTDSVSLVAGTGIQIQTNGQSIIISTAILPSPPFDPSKLRTSADSSQGANARIEKLEATIVELRNDLATLKARMQPVE